jgi:Holliday junction resolvasome RuvABC endonuclease subunit
MILALDLGTQTGVAYGCAGDAPTLTTWQMPKGGGTEVGRFGCTFEAKLRAIVDELQPTLIYYEAPFLMGKGAKNPDTMRRLYGLPMVVEMVACKRGIEVAEAVIKSVRLLFAGAGNAKKYRVWQAAKERGFNPETEHEADAVAVWWHALHERHGHNGDLMALYDPLFIAGGRA